VPLTYSMSVPAQLREIVRRSVHERERMLLSRLSVAAGLRPRINRGATPPQAFPEGRRAAVVLSADLELAWAWRFARGVDGAAVAHQRAVNGRRNMGVILDMCDRLNIPITWATVGHLLLERCNRANGTIHPEVPRVPYFENHLWSYEHGDWFDADPGASDRDAAGWADWHGPDLIRNILDRKTDHEIGCHTFSHAVFSDRLCPAPVARAELSLCQQVAADWGLRLQSFAFSGNLEGNHHALRENGFRIYRVDDWYDLDVPRRDAYGLWRLNGGVCLDRPYLKSRAKDHIQLLKHCVDVAIERGLVCGFWFHPETSPRDVEEIFPSIFEYIASRRDDLWVTTMGGLADWLDATVPPAQPTLSTHPASPRPTAYVCSLFDTGLAAVRSLGRAGIPVVGLDSNPHEPGFKSRYGEPRRCPDPITEPECLVDYLLAEGRRQAQPGVLIPASDAWVLFISRYRDRLEPFFRFRMPAPEVVEAIIDKRRQYELAEQVGTPYPATFYPTTLAEARECAEHVDYPAFLKPYYGHLWRERFGGAHKGYKVHTPHELLSCFQVALAADQPVMVQSIILGPNTNHYKVCAYLDEAGDPLAVFTLRKLRQYPTEFGVGSLVESVWDDDLLRLGLHFMQAIGYRGIGSVEFKRDDRDGKLKLIELNPRLWQQNSQAAVCGVDFPLIAYRDMIGEPALPVPRFRAGVRWLDAPADFQAAWDYFRRGELSPLNWLASMRGVEAFATFALDDPAPFFSNYEYGLKALRLPIYLMGRRR
jgi:D-aspartate ligase